MVHADTTTDEIVITATYEAEDFDGAETVTRKRNLAGDAVNKGDDKVGLPSDDHGCSAGDRIVIAGTTNYDGVRVLLDETTTDEIVFDLEEEEDFESETFTGAETVALCYQWYKALFDIEEVVFKKHAPPEWRYRIDNGAESLLGYLHMVDGLVGGTVRLVFVHSENLHTDKKEFENTTNVLSADGSMDVIHVNCGVENPYGAEFPLGRFWPNFCVAKFKGGLCQYNGAENVCDKARKTCRETMFNEHHYLGTPGSRYGSWYAS